MENSLFIEYVQKWFKPIAKSLETKVNGKEGERKYYFLEHLSKDEAIDLTWASEQLNQSIVSADVVTMDSELPLKRRDSMQTAKGDIPKIGMKTKFNEKQLKQLTVMERTGSNEDSIVKKLFAPTKKNFLGVYERIEDMYLTALATGAMLVDDPDNNKVGIRVNYNPTELTTANSWGDATTSNPIDDIDLAIDKSSEKGIALRYMLLNRNTLNKLKKSQAVKELYAGYLGIGLTSGTKAPTPTTEGIKNFLKDEKNIEIVVIDKTIITEVNGKRTSKQAWADDKVTFLPELNTGRLVHSSSVEESKPVEGVSYEKADFVLLSKYRKNDPVAEFSSAQAFALPVLDIASEMIIMDVA